MFADLIDGPLAHLPSGRFASNSAGALCAMITHNLLRAADTLDPHQAGGRVRRHPAPPGRARPGTAGPDTTPARAAPTPTLALGTTMAGHLDRSLRSSPRAPSSRLTPDHRRTGTTGDPDWKSWADQRHHHAP